MYPKPSHWSRSVVSLAAIALGACSADATVDQANSSATTPGLTADDLRPAPAAKAEQSEQAEQAGFFFLAPIVSDAAPEGTFDPSLSPTVRIEPIDANGRLLGPAVATFTRNASRAAARVDVDQDEKAYVATWNTSDPSLARSKTYRIRVLLGGRQLGFTDVVFGAKPHPKRHAVPADKLVIVPGTKLLVRFFLNDCADGACDAAPGASAISPDLGDTFGGGLVSLKVKGDVRGVRISDRECGNLVHIDETTVSCTAPQLPPGHHDVSIHDGHAWTVALPGRYEAWHPTVDFPDARVFQADRGITSSGNATRWRIGIASQNVKGASTIDPVDGSGLFQLASGRLILIGGAPAGHASDVVNTVWSSDDGGTTWNVLLDNDPATTTRFQPGHTMGFAVHTQDGVPYAYVIGGDPFAPNGDVWRTRLDGDGTAWTRISTSAPTASLALSMVFSYRGALYVAGGQHSIYDAGSAVSTVHRSTDGGVTWTSLGEAPWTPRGMVLGQLPVHDGLIYLVGGGAYDGVGEDGDQHTYYNDVWTFDGQTWRQVLGNGHDQFPAVRYHSLVESRGRLWIFNGVIPGGVEVASAHSSGDGRSWAPIGVDIPWSRTHAQAALAVSDGIVLTDGFQSPKMFKIVEHQGALVSSWADQGSAGLRVAQGDEPAKPILDTQAFGNVPGLVFTGAQSLRLSAVDSGAKDGVLETFVIGRTRTFRTDASLPMNAPSTIIGNGSESVWTGFGFAGGGLRYVQYTNGWQATDAGDGFNDDRVRLFAAKHTATSVQLSAGGIDLGAPDTTDVSIAPWVGWDTIGAGYLGYDHAEMVVGAIVMLQPTASSPDLSAKLEKWSRKWGTASK